MPVAESPLPGKVPGGQRERRRGGDRSDRHRAPQPQDREQREHDDRSDHDPDRDQPARHRMTLCLRIDVCDDPAAHRAAAAPSDQRGILAQVAAPAPAERGAERHEEQRREPGEPEGERAPGRQPRHDEQRNLQEGEPAQRGARERKRVEGARGKREALYFDVIAKAREQNPKQVAGFCRPGRAGFAREREHALELRRKRLGECHLALPASLLSLGRRQLEPCRLRRLRRDDA
jgi:hypothetical protein